MLGLLILFSVSVFLEFALHLPGPFWHFRKVWAVISLVCVSAASSALVASWVDVASMMVLMLSCFRAFNLVRLVFGRMHENYLERVTFRTSVVLIGLQAVVIGLWAIWDRVTLSTATVWVCIASLWVVVAAVLLASVIRSVRKTRWPASGGGFSDRELPTVTVAIPARNETIDLQDCLRSLIASDYPKLEILVLDDCSQIARTPEIIRSFAHDGVRFVKGEAPKETWLPKNQAYARLAQEASGDYLLFCGVDIRFAPQSIREIMTQVLHRKKTMLSIMPRRSAATRSSVAVAQAMRYWWELVPPRRLLHRPPVLSSCWVIQAKALKECGGFDSARRAIVPEAHLAYTLQGRHDGYSFLRSDGVGIESSKSSEEQKATAVRTRYPQVHRRPENVLIVSLFELLFLVAPFAFAIAGFWLDVGIVSHLLSIAACVLLIASYESVAIATRINSWGFALVALPLLALSDISMLYRSMWKYEFSIVEWKGRNICIPAMHVVPHLPKI